MMNEFDQHDEPAEDRLDRQIKSDRADDPPADLLARCLATIDPAAASTPVSRPAEVGRRRFRWTAVMSLAAAVLVACLVLFSSVTGKENLLAQVLQAFDRAPSFHIRLTTHLRHDGLDQTQVAETWVVRDKGRRTEVREGEKLVTLIVDGMRWKLQWNVGQDQVTAWPSQLAAADARARDDFLLFDRDQILDWAKTSQIPIESKKDQLDGREVEKIELMWPGEPSQTMSTMWFDPRSRRPIKLRHVSAELGLEQEYAIDYPAADEIAAERFAFEVPSSAELEINDPQLGRQIYSPGQKGPDLRQ